VPYIEIKIECSSKDFCEIIEAEIMDFGFESFEVNEAILRGFAKQDQIDRAAVDQVLLEYQDHISSIIDIVHEDENWNSVWESNFEPVTIGDELFIGATFHDIPDRFKHSIVIDPNMSFGTGHHPTTEMMIRKMMSTELDGKIVLDFGCGTGILAIYADYKGASGVAIEIDKHVATCARNNLKANKSNNFEVITGGVESIQNGPFDLILANINRNVIEESLKTFIKSLNLHGQLVCSGFLVSDIDGLTDTLSKAGLEIINTDTIGDWALIAANKTT